MYQGFETCLHLEPLPSALVSLPEPSFVVSWLSQPLGTIVFDPDPFTVVIAALVWDGGGSRSTLCDAMVILTITVAAEEYT